MRSGAFGVGRPLADPGRGDFDMCSQFRLTRPNRPAKPITDVTGELFHSFRGSSCRCQGVTIPAAFRVARLLLLSSVAICSPDNSAAHDWPSDTQHGILQHPARCVDALMSPNAFRHVCVPLRLVAKHLTASGSCCGTTSCRLMSC